ncbi:MAG TPA: 50S ribosomal protein L30e [Candidatus Thermoplasmatota archaeon]|nr:50S ribosomal protein L30e [Candidatus Thermoplasmatota archaeon]
MDVNRALRNAAATGKVTLGLNETLKDITAKKAKLVVVAQNAPKDALAQVQAAAQQAKVPLYTYQGKNTELGPACGKPYSVAVLSVADAGDSDVLQLAKGA